MSTESVTAAADKRDMDQFMAGWVGLLVCGLVAAVIWFFGIRSVMNGDDGLQTSALECAPTYGVAQAEGCTAPEEQLP